MSFKIEHDYFNNPIVPSYILCKANKERIGSIKCIDKDITVKFNSLDEINFSTYLYIDGEKNPYYDLITEMKYILLPNVGFYAISSVAISSEGTEFESKQVNAKSYECLLGQKYLEEFVINMGTVESIDGVQFYNIADKSKSLLHLVLEKCPDWKIGHIDSSLITMERSFEVSKQDIYSFITNDISEAFECIFVFDTLTNTINIYKEDTVGEDTNIHVSYNNLLKSTNISSSTDNIKTCMTLAGADDLNIREVNMGYDRIYNFDYYNSTEYMSQSLYDAYNAWIVKRNAQVDPYTLLLADYEDYYIQINELTHIKMPKTAGSTDWTEYGLVPLQEQLATYERQQSTMMKAGYGEADNKYYESRYLPVYNTIQAINAQLDIINAELDELKNKQNAVYEQMSAIINGVSMENNFTEEQLQELSAFIRETDLSSQNFIVTDTMTEEEKFAMLHEFLDYGTKELAKVATPQLSFSADMVNLFAIEEFKCFNGAFEPGNYIRIKLRDDYYVKARLLSMTFDFHDVSNFSVTFGNVMKNQNELFDVTEAIAQAQSAATSVSFNASYWSQAAKDTDNINKVLDEGLLAAGKYLSSGEDSEFLIDKRGVFLNTTSGEYAGKDSIFMGGGRILFTDDNWKTVKMSVGRATVKGESKFGTFADFVVAGYIGASQLEGGTITGTDFNNGNGTFHVDANGNLTATSATIKGEITADSGTIGGENGFTITEKGIYNTKASFSSETAGVYIGTDGIALGAKGAFKVDNAGNLTATSGTFGGIKIGSNKIYSENENFSVTSSGYATFKNVYISGVTSGSSFGSIGYNGSTTWGSFGGSSYFGSSVGSPFSGTCVSHIKSISADYIYGQYIEGIYGRFNSIEATYLKASEFTADKISAMNITVKMANVTGSLSVNRLSAASVTVSGTTMTASWEYGNIVRYITTKNVTVKGSDGNNVTIKVIDSVSQGNFMWLGA